MTLRSCRCLEGDGAHQGSFPEEVGLIRPGKGETCRQEELGGALGRGRVGAGSGGARMQLEFSTSCVSQISYFLLCISVPSSVTWAWGHPGQHVEVRIR